MASLKKPNKADLMAYKAFKTALEKDKINLYINDSIFNRPGLPVYCPWENLLPKLIPVLIGLLTLYYSIFLGIVIILGSVGVGERLFRKNNHHRLFERVKKYVLGDYDNLLEMWKLGGVVMVVVSDNKKSCVAPEGDWKDFIVQNFADLMLDSKEETIPETVVEEKPTSRIGARLGQFGRATKSRIKGNE